jgi:hypothetical protein
VWCCQASVIPTFDCLLAFCRCPLTRRSLSPLILQFRSTLCIPAIPNLPFLILVSTPLPLPHPRHHNPTDHHIYHLALLFLP